MIIKFTTHSRIKIKKIRMERAYFRELVYTKQCELVFPLQLKNSKSKVVLEEEIHALRGNTDNIQSLLDHTKNKIKKLLEDKENINIELKTSLTIKNKPLSGNTECKHIISLRNVEFRICKQHFQVIMNAPLVHCLCLPTMLYVKHEIRPVKFKSIYTDINLSDFIWFVSTDKSNWYEAGKGYKYVPKNQDVNKFVKLRCIPRNTENEGPWFEVESEMAIEYISNIPSCPFEKRHGYTPTYLKGKNFRVVSYNILSNRYSELNSHFSYCTPQALSIEYRKQLVLKELKGYNADIMCLQEVDHMVYMKYYKPKLAYKYKSVMHKKGNRVSEGLACFYNTARFDLLDSKQIVFNLEVRKNSLFRPKWNLIKKSDTLKTSLIKQPTSLEIVTLQSKEFEEIIIVANTHLYYHADADDIRLLQSSIAVDYISCIAKKYRNQGSRVSVIFCGDFNSVPTSNVYKFISQGVLHHSLLNEPEPPIENITFTHPFRFESACGIPTYTNYTADFKGCLDYIFYDKEAFTVTDSVPMPDEDVLAEKVALPSEFFPSDHIALVANLQFL